jgi:hypothetical protein
MINNFKIAIYKNNDGIFNIINYDEYIISYIKGKKPHQLRIVVNSYLSNNIINLVDGKSGYKNNILQAIGDFKNKKINLKNKVSDKSLVTLSYITMFYSKCIVHNVNQYLIGINKETSRDKLTKFNLI